MEQHLSSIQKFCVWPPSFFKEKKKKNRNSFELGVVVHACNPST